MGTFGTCAPLQEPDDSGLASFVHREKFMKHLQAFRRPRPAASLPLFLAAAILVGAALPAASEETRQIPQAANPISSTRAHYATYVCHDDCTTPSGLTLARDGQIYGVAALGGPTGFGTAFRLTSDGVLTVLHTFGPEDGSMPLAALVQASDGDLYGTAAYDVPFGGEGGSVFKMSTSGEFTVLHRFSGSPDGSGPAASLVQASDGNLYGTTLGGGSGNQGTVFRIGRDGSYESLYAFDGNAVGFNGTLPLGPLIQARDGFLYGTTYYGGTVSAACRAGCGTVFRMDLDGHVLAWAPLSAQAGINPTGALIQATDGYLYGTAEVGGDIARCRKTGCGTVFRFDPSDASILPVHQFRATEGAGVVGGLLLASDGNFYGNTSEGGDLDACGAAGFDGCGTVFRMTPAGELTKLHVFRDSPDGAQPAGTLIQGADGALYGTTSYGGYVGVGNNFPYGVLFRLRP
jgi:uncharacterized repeat protein (TIGR03803 family)